MSSMKNQPVVFTKKVEKDPKDKAVINKKGQKTPSRGLKKANAGDSKKAVGSSKL